jgi:hypothetical protein
LIDFRRLSAEAGLIGAAFSTTGRRAQADSGVAPLRQLGEMMLLRLGRGKLEAEDYYKMRLYRKELPLSEKRKYLSQGAVPLCNRWGVLADDKLLAYSVLDLQGIRTPRVHAIVHPLRLYRDCPTLKSSVEIQQYLSGAPYPFFAKPIRGIFSRNVMLVEGYVADSERLCLAGGSTMSADEFASRCVARRNGMLFQEVLRPHPDIASNIGPRLCTLRLIVLLETDRARLFRSIWKIATGDNVADNYWRPGNIIARLDRETGRIEQCMTGLGPDFRLVDNHPTTGLPLRGFQVPCYHEAVELTLRASRAFIGLKMQAWDIAIAEEGPMPLEVNEVGSVFLPQIADQRGLDDPEFRLFVANARAMGEGQGR